MSYSNINKSTNFFDTLLYTGDGSATQSISGLNFQPDFIWIKSRGNTHDHYSWDAVRTNKKGLEPSDNSAERTPTLGSFDNDGFTFASTDGFYNDNSDTYVAWNWKANGAGSANTDGTINSTVSANTTSGFSIVTYTGTGSSATVGHGLGVAPAFITVKRLDTTDSWQTYHKTLGAGKFMQLNGTDAEATNNNRFGGTEPTTTVFSIGTDTGVNASGGTYVAYCWAEKTGYCKVGSYVANGNNDGNFIYLGHKPKFFLLKAYTGGSASSRNWLLYDYKRNGINGDTDATDNRSLRPNNGNTEATSSGYHLDILSNGVKLRNNSGDINTSGETYLYVSIGQTMVGTNNVPCTAR